MTETGTQDRVRLKHDLPQLGLPRGAEGILCSIWDSSLKMYEIRFLDAVYGCQVLLPAHHIDIEYVGAVLQPEVLP